MPKLICNTTEMELVVGDTVKTFRGELRTITYLAPNEGMNGKVYLDNAGYYPSVINAKFVYEEVPILEAI